MPSTNRGAGKWWASTASVRLAASGLASTEQLEHTAQTIAVAQLKLLLPVTLLDGCSYNPHLQMSKLRHREVQSLTKVPQPANGRAGI